MRIKKYTRILGVWILITLIAGCTSTSITEHEPLPVSDEEIVVKGYRRVIIESEDARRVSQEDTPEPIVTGRYWNRDENIQIFRDYGVNPTILTDAKPDSTFALDVDDGSYKLALTMLSRGHLPSPEGIRVEEFVNALHYRYLNNNDVFTLSAEAMPSPFRKGYHILHLGLQTKPINDNERVPANIVLIADVSGSMASGQKLVLLKEAFSTLVAQLNRQDRVALVAYSDNAEVILHPTSADQKRTILSAINRLEAQGSTNAENGIELGYRLAHKMYEPGLNNRVVFSSDGMANVGVTTPEGILQRVKRQKEKGIFLTTVGVGVGMYNDALLEQLADQGNGHYLYLGNSNDIQSAFVDRLNTQLQTVAKNAKAQVIFNPDAVSHYRLLGYENRGLKKEDFLDATKDGGEVGAGHRVTAIYEVKLNPSNLSAPLGTFSVAYQKPSGRKVNTISKDIPRTIVATETAKASSDMKLSASAAAFAEKLRMSYWSGLYRYEDVLSLLSSLPASYSRDEQVKQLEVAIRQANELDHRDSPHQKDYSSLHFDLDRVPLLQ